MLKPNCFDKNKRAWAKKNILIMGKKAQTIELSTKLGINYIPCCSIVLMCYNVLGYEAWRIRSHTNIQEQKTFIDERN